MNENNKQAEPVQPAGAEDLAVYKRISDNYSRTPPAVAVNEQMLKALKLADAALEGAHMNADVVYKKVKAAIAAAQKELGK